MGMTVWVHILDGRKIVGNQQDCSWLAQLAEPLDAICEQRGVGKLSGYFDYTDLQHNMGEGGDPDAEPDPETGWAWGIDDMKWFPAADAVRTLQALKSAVPEAGSIGKLPADRSGELVAEIDDCLQQLEPAAAAGKQFHFTVLM
jgi:hypothetical protein